MGAKTVYLLTNGTLSYLSFFAFFQPFLKCNLCFCWAQTGACEMRRDISHFFFLRNFISLLFEKRGALCKGAYSPKPSFLDLLLSFQEFPLLSSMHTKSNPPENTLNTNE